MQWDALYLFARQWGIQPSEFWGMTMGEWHCEYELHSDDLGGEKFAGNLTQGDVDEMLYELDLSDEEWWKENGITNGQG